MKFLFSCFSEKTIRPLLLFLFISAMVVLGFVIFQGKTSLQSCKNDFCVSNAVNSNTPSLPQPVESSEPHGSFQVAIPGSPVPVVVSRRNFDSLTLREFHSGNSGIIYAESVPFSAYIQSKKCEKITKSIFQDFIQRSLPPRAGPEFV